MEKDGQMKISFTDKRFSRAKSVDILSQTTHRIVCKNSKRNGTNSERWP